MKILYISSVPSTNEFNNMKRNLKKDIINDNYGMLESSFKFHSLILNGLSQDKNNEILNLVGRPISSKSHKKIFWKSSFEKQDNLSYYHLFLINYPFLKQIVLALIYFMIILVWLVKNYKNKEKIVLIDGAYISIVPVLVFLTSIIKSKKIAMVCDVYEYMAKVKDARNKEKGIHHIIRKYINKKYKKMDGFIFLTDKMSNVVNPANKPFIVMEGLVDKNMQTRENSLENKYKEQVIIYAGSLRIQYGIKVLVEGFMEYKNKHAQLWIYGNGDYVEELKKQIKKDCRIKYFGIKSNSEVINSEIKGTILVNPRPINQEFTKYSFPSKNMEYMVSGTPILTTKLPGMPKEYYNYIYVIEKDGKEGITDSLNKVLSLSKQELHEKGLEAKEFVLREKNNLVQAKRIVVFIQQILKGDLNNG